MMRLALALPLALLCLLPLKTQGADKAGSCVECHRRVEGVAYLEHNMADWERSAHSRAGAACEKCHGGNPSSRGKTAAHAGMLPSADPSSPVYFTRVPATCGACHEAEFKAFKKSDHYRELQTTGRGPNCVTCHGSMANHILAPRELEMTCTICHRRPTQAYAALMSLNNAGSSLRRLDAALGRARSVRLDASRQERDYKEMLTLHRKALEDWHTFNMQEALWSSREITKRAANALNELRIKGLQQDGTPGP